MTTVQNSLAKSFYRIVGIFLLACLVPAAFVRADTSAQQPSPHGKKHTVLILNSHQQGLPIPDGVIMGLLNELKSHQISVDDLFVEHLDLLRVTTPEHKVQLVSGLREKLTGRRVDLIITVTKPALDFLEHEGKDLFSHAPVLATIVPSDFRWQGPPRDVAILPWRLDCAGTLQDALALFPRTRRVVVVAGAEDQFLPFLAEAKADMRAWRGKLTFEYTDDRSYEEMLQRIRSLPPNTIIICAPYFADRTGRSFIPAEVVARIAREANAPVFALLDAHVGTGAIGGNVLKTFDIGTLAGRFVVSFLAGQAHISGQTVLGAPPYVPLFDWRQLKRWKYDPGVLPVDSVFLNRPSTLWGQYKAAVIGSAVVTSVLVALVLALVLQNHRRKLAEEAVRLSEKRYRNIVETASEGIWMVDAAQRTTYVNKVMAEMLGQSPEGMLGQMPTAYIFPEDLVDYADKAARRQGGENQVFERRFRHRDGHVVWGLVSAKLLSDNQVGGAASLVMVADISKRKLQEDALKRSEQEFRLLAEAMPQIVWVCSPDGLNTYFNQQWVDYTGLTLEESYGDGWNKPFHPDDQQQAWGAWKNAVRSNGAYAIECRLRRKDGVYSWWLIRGVPVIDEQGGILKWFGTCTDIDRLKSTEESLIQARNAAEAANRTKSQFLANMSHEIRTPLNGVLGMLNLIKTSEVSGEVDVYAEMAIRAGKRLTSLLGDILDLSRIEAGRLPVVRLPFALADIIVALTDTFSPSNFSKRLSFTINVDPDVPTRLVGDEIRVRQILFNLIGNAMKFTELGEVRLELSLLPFHPPGMSRLLFIISDTGGGIPDDQMDQIFHPFVQVEGTFTRSHQGAGLGLAIAKYLVDAMGGTITFESVVNQGTTVYLMLPFGLAEDSPAAPGPQLGQDDQAAASRLLLVEDDEISRLSARVALEKMGHQVVTANHGEEALEALRSGRYDCVLMDVQMDVMDGLEATRRIRSGASGVLDAHVPVIAMTAYAMTGDRERFLDAGMDDYVAKPVQAEELEKALVRVLGKRSGSTKI
ncbi:MAG: PAS domain S-box protein [Humidesulfovibrio sp.]|nr:PAS domain S-box protein [Humidesulfovibrio sp.]